MEKCNYSLKAMSVFESRGLNGQEDQVKAIKEGAAVLWDLINEIHVLPVNTEAGRLIALAKTDLESSVMWAVKALSRNSV